MGTFRKHLCPTCRPPRYKRAPGTCSVCGSLLKTGPWCVEWLTLRGERKTETVDGGKRAAETLLAKRKTEAKEGKAQPGKVRLGVVAEEFLGLRHGELERVERSMYALHLEPVFGGLQLSQIRRRDILEYIEKRKREKNPWGRLVARGTISRELAILRGIWNHAVAEELVEHYPFVKLGVSKKPPPINKYLTGEEEDLLFDHLPAPSLPLYRFLAETAARSKEARGLMWKRVDWQSKIAWVEGKTSAEGELQALYLSDKILTMMEGLPRLGEFVFTNPKTLKPFSYPRQVLIETAETTGLNDRLQKSGRDRINGPHYLRHSCISRWIMAGNDLATVAKLARHSNIQQTMRYTHLSPDHLRKALNGR